MAFSCANIKKEKEKTKKIEIKFLIKCTFYTLISTSHHQSPFVYQYFAIFCYNVIQVVVISL